MQCKHFRLRYEGLGILSIICIYTTSKPIIKLKPTPLVKLTSTPRIKNTEIFEQQHRKIKWA